MSSWNNFSIFIPCTMHLNLLICSLSNYFSYIHGCDSKFLHVSTDGVNCVWYVPTICKYVYQLKQGLTVTLSVRPLGMWCFLLLHIMLFQPACDDFVVYYVLILLEMMRTVTGSGSCVGGWRPDLSRREAQCQPELPHGYVKRWWKNFSLNLDKEEKKIWSKWRKWREVSENFLQNLVVM